jgi:hypothetical protein
MLRVYSPRLLLGAMAVVASIAAAPPAWADGISPEKATAAQRDEAQAHFTKGRELFGQGQFARALDEFQASREVVASPNAHLYAARSLREMGKLGAAYVEFERTATEARVLSRQDDKYVKTAESADQERQELATKLGFVRVNVANAKDGTVLRVGGEEIRRADWNDSIPTPAGQTEVVVESPQRAPVRQTVDVTAGQTKTVSVDADAASANAAPAAPGEVHEAEPEDEAESRRQRFRTLSFVAAGVGVVGVGTFTIFGAMANGKYSDLKNQCGGPCAPSRQSDIDAGKRDQTVANVGLVVGLLGAAAAVTLFVVSMPKKSAAPQTALILGPGGAGIGGAF